ncbi:endothelin-converting enzyme 2-like [Amblyomma americanum]
MRKKKLSFPSVHADMQATDVLPRAFRPSEGGNPPSPPRRLIVQRLGLRGYCSLWVTLACLACLALGCVLRGSPPTWNPEAVFPHKLDLYREQANAPTHGFSRQYGAVKNTTVITDVMKVRMDAETEPFAITTESSEAFQQASDSTSMPHQDESFTTVSRGSDSPTQTPSTTLTAGSTDTSKESSHLPVLANDGTSSNVFSSMSAHRENDEAPTPNSALPEDVTSATESVGAVFTPLPDTDDGRALAPAPEAEARKTTETTGSAMPLNASTLTPVLSGQPSGHNLSINISGIEVVVVVTVIVQPEINASTNSSQSSSSMKPTASVESTSKGVTMKTSPNGNFTNGANITDIFTGSVSSSSPGSASTVRSMKTSSQRPFEETSSKISSVNKTTLTPTLSQMTRSTEPISRNVTERGSSIRSSVTKPLTSDTEDYNSSSLSSTKNPQANTSMFTVETDGDSLNFTSVSNATTKVISTSSVPKNTTKRPSGGEQILCNTSFCKREGSRLSGIFKSGRDPCDDFYAFACSSWRVKSTASQMYEDVDDAIAGAIEELVKTLLQDGSSSTLKPLTNVYGACMKNASASNDDLRKTLASLGFNLTNPDNASAEDVLKTAASLLVGFDIAPLFSVALHPDLADRTAKVLALDEADVLLSREDASGNASAKKFTGLVCKFLQSVEVAATTVNMTVVGCDFIAQVAIEMAKSSSKQDPFVDRMQNYSAKPFSSIAFFTPMISEMKLIDGVIARATKVVVKNPMQLKKLEFLLTSEPSHVYLYLAFHLTVYLSPFLEEGQRFWGTAAYFLTGHNRRGPVPKWRLCVRLVDHVLPSLLIMSFEKHMNNTLGFSELMAYVLAEEVRSSFLDEFSHLEPVDSWTKHIISQKIEDVRILSLFPARYAANSLVTALVRKIQAEVPMMSQPLDYFLNISSFLGSMRTDPRWQFLVEGRSGVSLFITDCYYYPERNAVVLPLSLFNISVPTSAKEGMFHMPRIGPRLANCLFRATFGMNIFNDVNFFWTDVTLKHLEATSKCLEKHYSKQNKVMSMESRAEESSALVIAFEAFKEKLFTKQYMNSDYGLYGLPDVTADQLFFVYYALDYCARPDNTSKSSNTVLRDRVNVPLKNSYEFATAFNCAANATMNPAKKCSFWD